MNEQMKQAWLEISQMLGETTPEELDVFLRTWQRATEAHRKALAEQPAQRTWVGLTDEEIDDIYQGVGKNDLMLVREVEAALRSKNT